MLGFQRPLSKYESHYFATIFPKYLWYLMDSENIGRIIKLEYSSP